MNEIDHKSINTIRMLAVDAVEKANSGHPGLPLGAAPAGYALWQHFYQHNPKNPHWLNRDRFVLSAGHGSMLHYALLHLSGYDVTLDDLEHFRQWQSKTPGHPEFGHTPGIETTTGPLGQGFATSVGMAMAERFLGQTFNTDQHTLFDYHVYGIASDGDLMEGVAAEAASIAGNLQLGKLIYMYDSNRISIEGSTDLAFTEDVAKRFDAYKWQVLDVEDGNDAAAIATAIASAQTDPRPSLIIVHSHIGFGTPKQDSEAAHGSPLGAEARKATREFYSWPDEDFHIPSDVAKHMAGAITRGAESEAAWQPIWEAYQAEEPEKAALITTLQVGKLPAGWDQALPTFDPADYQTGIATRSASEAVMQEIAKAIPTFMGGSADLASSNKTFLKDLGAWTGLQQEEVGRNQHYGIREHAMAAITNGLALSGIVIPFAATFFIFSDYARGAIRLSALMGLRSIYVLTHDSIAQGEDGATHQPIEHLASFRAMPNMRLWRPADANETTHAWRQALLRTDGPSLLVLSRQNLPVIDRTTYAAADGLARGGYVLNPDVTDPQAIIIATGSEVSLALQSATELATQGMAVRVVSMPSFELFSDQDQAYQDEVLPPHIIARVVVEAGTRFGWERFVGRGGGFVTIDTFGASAPGDVLMHEFGFTVDTVIATVKQTVASTTASN
jgi:transketolase